MSEFVEMTSKRMLSKKQCIFVIVIMPLLLIPAFIILRMAEPKYDIDLLLSKHLPPDIVHMARKSTNRPNKALIRSRPHKCTDYIWTGTCHDTCHKFNVMAKQTQRRQQTLVCDPSKTQLKTLYTKKAKYVPKIPFKDVCLRKMVDWYCQDGKKVPNIIHYVWFGKNEFKFVHFLSFLSAHKMQNPCMIMVHADRMPKGSLWRYFLQISPKVVQVHRKPPKKIFKKKLTFIEHKADIAKLEALKEYGGIYLDTDQVLLKSVNKYRNFDATIGMEYEKAAANSIVIAKKNSLFIKYWYDGYRSYARTDGNQHSNVLPYKLSKKHKDLVHMAEDIFAAPNAKQLPLLYSRNIDWSKHYGVHLHGKVHDRFYGDTFTIDSVRSMNTTAGAIARYIVYGNQEVCHQPRSKG